MNFIVHLLLLVIRTQIFDLTAFHYLIFLDDSNAESRRKEAPLPRLESLDQKNSTPEETKKEAQPTPKRAAEESVENTPEAKKICIKQEVAPVLEDDLSEISDDADEILNRDEVNSFFLYIHCLHI